MKTLQEEIQYKNLRIRMESKCDSMGISWASYYAYLLNFGGKSPEQYLRNYFINSDRKFNPEQLTLIYNDLDDMSHIKPLSQTQVKNEVMLVLSQLGILSQKIVTSFDQDESIDFSEVSVLIPTSRDIYSKAQELYLSLLETKQSLK